MTIYNKLSLYKVEQLLQSQIANRPPLLCFVVDDVPCNFKCTVSHNHASFQKYS